MSNYSKNYNSQNLSEESDFILYPPPPNREDILYPPNINIANSNSSEELISENTKSAHAAGLNEQDDGIKETGESLKLDKTQIEPMDPVEMLRSLYLLYLKINSSSDKTDELLKQEIQTLPDNSHEQNIVVEVLDKQSDTTKSITESIMSEKSPVKEVINPIDTLHSLYLFHKDRKK